MRKEYLESGEKEVVDIMMVLYDEEEIMRTYVESEVYEATQRVTQQVTKQVNFEMAKQLLEDGTLPMEKIAKFSNLPIETIQHLADDLSADKN